jgi:hypothetical protein
MNNSIYQQAFGLAASQALPEEHPGKIQIEISLDSKVKPGQAS